MAYTLSYSLALGPAYAATSDLRAQLVDTSGANVGSAISTGFVIIGSGYHLWNYASMPDDHRGGVKFYSLAASSVVLGFLSVNPQETEYTDVKTSTRLASGNYTVPPTAVQIDTQLSGTHGAGSWATATGFATPTNVSDAQTAIIAAIPSASAAAAAVMAYVLESGKSFQVAMLDVWAVIVGDSVADDADVPTEITYDSPDGSAQITHELTSTSRTVA